MSILCFLYLYKLSYFFRFIYNWIVKLISQFICWFCAIASSEVIFSTLIAAEWFFFSCNAIAEMPMVHFVLVLILEFLSNFIFISSSHLFIYVFLSMKPHFFMLHLLLPFHRHMTQTYPAAVWILPWLKTCPGEFSALYVCLGYLWCSRETSAVKPLGDFNDGPKGNRLLDPLFNAALPSTFFLQIFISS